MDVFDWIDVFFFAPKALIVDFSLCASFFLSLYLWFPLVLSSSHSVSLCFSLSFSLSLSLTLSLSLPPSLSLSIFLFLRQSLPYYLFSTLSAALHRILKVQRLISCLLYIDLTLLRMLHVLCLLFRIMWLNSSVSPKWRAEKNRENYDKKKRPPHRDKREKCKKSILIDISVKRV